MPPARRVERKRRLRQARGAHRLAEARGAGGLRAPWHKVHGLAPPQRLRRVLVRHRQRQHRRPRPRPRRALAGSRRGPAHVSRRPARAAAPRCAAPCRVPSSSLVHGSADTNGRADRADRARARVAALRCAPPLPPLPPRRRAAAARPQRGRAAAGKLPLGGSHARSAAPHGPCPCLALRPCEPCPLLAPAHERSPESALARSLTQRAAERPGGVAVAQAASARGRR